MFDLCARISKCFRATKAKPREQKSKRLEMGCISCHDPHEEPAPQQRIRYYRDACLACHAEHGCRLRLEERLEKSKEDSCIDCHMPRIGSADIAHTALTDHRILRRASAGLPLLGPRGAPLVHFHRDQVQPDDPGVARDYGIALLELALRSRPQAIHFGVQALPILDAAVQQWPDDIAALNARAFALGMSDRRQTGLQVFEESLRKAPDREATLVDAATLTGYYLDRPDLSRPYWRRAVAVNPYNSRYHYEIARLDAVEGNWISARDACLAALRLNPVYADALQLLTTSYLRLDDRPKAEAQLEILLALKPSEAPELRRWFAEQGR